MYYVKNFVKKYLFSVYFSLICNITQAQINNENKNDETTEITTQKKLNINEEKKNNRDNPKLKELKRKKKYEFKIDGDSGMATFLSFIGCGFPFGQIYNEDYWTAVFIGIASACCWGFFIHSSNEQEKRLFSAKNEKEKKKIKNDYANNELKLILGAIHTIHFISVIQSFISASMKEVYEKE